MKKRTIFLMLVSYIFAIKPNKPRMMLPVNIFGHRGLYDNKQVYENSFEAFDLCIDEHIGIELDIQTTRDDMVVVIHDDRTDNFCDEKKLLAHMNYDELSCFPYKVPTFKEALEHIDSRTPIIIEFKTDHVDPIKLCKLAWKDLRHYNGVYYIKSFDYRVLLWFRINHPEVIRGLLISRRYSKISDALSTQLFTNIISRPDFISCRIDCLKRPAVLIYKKLFKGRVAGWTINSKKDFPKYVKKLDIILYDPYMKS